MQWVGNPVEKVNSGFPNLPFTTCKLTSASGMTRVASEEGRQEYFPPSAGSTPSME